MLDQVSTSDGLFSGVIDAITIHRKGRTEIPVTTAAPARIARRADIARRRRDPALIRAPASSDDAHRSEERRVGNECVRTCRLRWSPYTSKKKRSKITKNS